MAPAGVDVVGRGRGVAAMPPGMTVGANGDPPPTGAFWTLVGIGNVGEPGVTAGERVATPGVVGVAVTVVPLIVLP